MGNVEEIFMVTEKTSVIRDVENLVNRSFDVSQRKTSSRPAHFLSQCPAFKRDFVQQYPTNLTYMVVVRA
jgi:hypothetical protein